MRMIRDARQTEDSTVAALQSLQRDPAGIPRLGDSPLIAKAKKMKPATESKDYVDPEINAKTPRATPAAPTRGRWPSSEQGDCRRASAARAGASAKVRATRRLGHWQTSTSPPWQPAGTEIQMTLSCSPGRDGSRKKRRCAAPRPVGLDPDHDRKSPRACERRSSTVYVPRGRSSCGSPSATMTGTTLQMTRDPRRSAEPEHSKM